MLLALVLGSFIGVLAGFFKRPRQPLNADDRLVSCTAPAAHFAGDDVVVP